MRLKNRHKILFIIPSLRPGGAERVFSFLAQEIDQDRFESQLLVVGNSKDSAYNVENIPVTYLNKKRVLYAIPSIFLFLIKHKPDLVLSSIGHLNTVMAILSPMFPKSKFAIREASVISVISKFSTNRKPWYSKLARRSYPGLDAIICQSRDMAEDFKRLYKIKADRLYVIGNPVTNTQKPAEDRTKLNGTNYVTVGRLSKEKGHERILRMLAKLDRDFHYTMIGDGGERQHLHQLIVSLGLQTRVTHIPFTKKVDKYLKKNNYFLQGSYVEGFPNAVLESCAMGTPVIAFDVPGGTKEILESGVNGFLVETEEEYISCLEKNISWSAPQISRSVLDKFGQDRVLQKYESLFDHLLGKEQSELLQTQKK